MKIASIHVLNVLSLTKISAKLASTATFSAKTSPVCLTSPATKLPTAPSAR